MGNKAVKAVKATVNSFIRILNPVDGKVINNAWHPDIYGKRNEDRVEIKATQEATITSVLGSQLHKVAQLLGNTDVVIDSNAMYRLVRKFEYTNKDDGTITWYLNYSKSMDPVEDTAGDIVL